MIKDRLQRTFIHLTLFIAPLLFWAALHSYGIPWIPLFVPKAYHALTLLFLPVLVLLILFPLSYQVKSLRGALYGSALPVLYVSGMSLYSLLTAFYYGMPRVSGLIWLDQTYRATTYNRYIAYSQTFDVTLCAGCLISLILTRYALIATWKHTLLPKSLGGVYKTLKSTTHGSAALCPRKRLYQLHKKEGIPVGGIISSPSYDEPQKLIQDIQKKQAKDILRLKVDHSVVIAPSGAGKGIGIVIPTLLDYEGSVLVTDIKGENYAVTAEARRAKGRKVYALDPFRITDRRSLGFLKATRIKPSL